MGVASSPIQEIGETKTEDNLTQSIIIKGKVEKSIPLLNSNAYKVRDASDSIWVVSGSQIFRVGEEVTIEGQLMYENIMIDNEDWGEFYLKADE